MYYGPHDDGAIALAQNKVLNFLNVGYNKIGAKGIGALKNSTITNVYYAGNDGSLAALLKQRMRA